MNMAKSDKNVLLQNDEKFATAYFADELSNQVQQLERFSRNKSCGVW